MQISSLVLELWQFSSIRDLTRNPEFGNTPIWVLSNIWRLEQVGNIKFGTNVSNKILLNDAKCQGYCFYRFWVIKRKPTGAGRCGGGDHPDYGYQSNIYLFKVNSWKTRKRCYICSKLTIKPSERCQWRNSGVFIVNFEHISKLFQLFLLLTLNMYMFTGMNCGTCKSNGANLKEMYCRNKKNRIWNDTHLSFRPSSVLF